MAAFYSLNAAISALNSLNYQINTTTGAINYGSFSLANLDVQTGCSIGWLINLGGGLDQVDTDLQQIYQTGAQDLVNGDVKKVQGYGPHVHSLANQALQALNSSNQALGTLDQYNDDVLCW
ncbi:hypothetical protein MMC28_000688 [Mycoblastus sanguinarius]|nr:hypothetical protein [Mycoblastus sanguinarius]